MGSSWFVVCKFSMNDLKTLRAGYDRFILWNRPETSSCQLPYQHHSSSADCAGELFKGSNGSASHLVCTQKTIFGWGCGFFESDIISEVVFRSFWLILPGLGPSCWAKDSDCSLVSNKNIIEIQHLTVWAQGQGGLKVFHLWRHSHKIRTPQPKFYFELQDLPSLLSFWLGL